jgi:hypothetical protein
MVSTPEEHSECSGRSVSIRGPKQQRTLSWRASPTGQCERKLGSADAEAACTGEGWACHRAVSREILLGIGNDRQGGHNHP